MIERGLPPQLIRWFMAFLTQRQARVRVKDMTSSFRTFMEGFPQGTILGPRLWDAFVDDIIPALLENIPETCKPEVLLYADDITITFRTPKNDDGKIKEIAQSFIDNLAAWEKENMAQVSLEKTSITVFPASGVPRTEANRPTILYPAKKPGDDTTPLKYDPTPKLLGLIYDEEFSFNKQIAEVKESMTKRMKLISLLDHRGWGSDRKTLRTTYL